MISDIRLLFFNELRARTVPRTRFRYYCRSNLATSINVTHCFYSYRHAGGVANQLHQVYPVSERKSISKESTFGEDIVDPAVLRDTLRWAAQEVGFLARHEGLTGAVVTLKIRFRPFETHTRSRTLAVRTASDGVIFRTAWELFQAEAWVGKPVRLIGVGLSGWEEQGCVQPDLFGNEAPVPHPQDQRLDETLDAIRRKFGKGYLQRGLSRRR